MASVRQRGRKWYASWKDAAGDAVERVLPGVRTKTQARAEAAELERLAFRAREGLEVLPSKGPLRGEAERYLHAIRHQASWVATESRWRLHILPALGDKPLGQVRSTDVDALLAAKRDEGYSQQTRRHLRVTLAAFFAWAMREGLVRENPVGEAEAIPVPEGAPKALSLAQVERVRDAARTPLMADLVWVAAHTALRPAELRRLTWDMVDLERRVIVLVRAKRGKLRPVPLAASLVPYLRAMYERRRGDYVFSREDGRQLPATFQPVKGFKAALRAAGLVEGWELVCRRKGCGHRERSPVKSSRPCPRCGFALWPRAMPMRLAFKDLRSTAVTIITEATGDLRVAQLVAGHESVRTTERHYAAARLAHLQAQVDRAFAPAAPAERVPTSATGTSQMQPSTTDPQPAAPQPHPM